MGKGMDYKSYLILFLLILGGVILMAQRQQPLKQSKHSEVSDILKQKGKLDCPVSGCRMNHTETRFNCGLGEPSNEVSFITSDSTVISVTNGTVTGQTEIKGLGKLVIVRNGDYLFVYSGLKLVYYKVGDSITQSAKIGSLARENNEYEVNFQIWKGQEKLNPEDWIKCLNKEGDTCFYRIKVPQDIDKGGLHFDTTIVRTKSCLIHILNLPPWGTGTDYTLAPQDTTLSRNIGKSMANLHSGRKGAMDISGLPVGEYIMHLVSCGNGGFFILRIK